MVLVDRDGRGPYDERGGDPAHDEKDHGPAGQLGQDLPDAAAAGFLRRERRRAGPDGHPVLHVQSVVVAGRVVAGIAPGAVVRHVVRRSGASGGHGGSVFLQSVMRPASSVRPDRGLDGNRTRSRTAVSPRRLPAFRPFKNGQIGKEAGRGIPPGIVLICRSNMCFIRIPPIPGQQGAGGVYANIITIVPLRIL
jgi:hypothetical protein